jgi:citrate synthase
MSDVADWWTTAIIDMAPGRIRMRGHPIETLIGKLGFAEMIWLMTRGDIPTPGQAALLDCALVAAVDHGPQAPSIAAARMAVTCGLGLNGAMATAVNMLDDVHGGAGEQAVELYHLIDAVEARVCPSPRPAPRNSTSGRRSGGGSFRASATGFTSPWTRARRRFWDGSTTQPPKGVVSGRFAAIARALEANWRPARARPCP